MFTRFFAIVVTLLSISLSAVVHGEACVHSSEDDETWLKSQPIEAMAQESDQSFVTQNVLGYLQSKSCKGTEAGQLVAELESARVRVIDGSICTENGQERVSVLLSHGQTNTFYCVEKK